MNSANHGSRSAPDDGQPKVGPIASITIFESFKLCRVTSAADRATKALRRAHIYSAKTVKLQPFLEVLFRSQSIKLRFPDDAQPIEIHGDESGSRL
jgi:hypothetical protein